MTGIDSYSTTPTNNAAATGGLVNWAEGQAPSTVNNSVRQNMTDIRKAFNDLVWFQYGSGDQGAGNLAVPAVYASATSFTIAGVDVSGIYQPGRRVRAVGSSTGTIYGTISTSVFSTNTTVTVAWDTGSLANETLTVSLSQMPSLGHAYSNAVPLTPYAFGAKGDGATDDTTAFVNFFAAIAGKYGYIPPGNYSIPNGLTLTGSVGNSGHIGTRLDSSRYAQITTTQSSGYAITMTNCRECELRWPVVIAGYSGLLMNSTVPNSTYNRVYFHRLGGAGKQSSKPSDPMANRIGIYIQGPTIGNANYYHSILPGTFITSFDTGIACYTPVSVGAMNSNANKADGVQLEGFWFGFYTNSVENRCVNARWYATGGTDANNLAECFRIGDGNYGTCYNRISGTAEPAGGFNHGGQCLSGTFSNRVEIHDNCPYGMVDHGSNDLISKNSWSLNATFLPIVLKIQVYTKAQTLALSGPVDCQMVAISDAPTGKRPAMYDSGSAVWRYMDGTVVS